jgi:hypothetical protein
MSLAIDPVRRPVSRGVRHGKATFRKWLAEQRVPVRPHEHHQRREGHVMVTIHRDNRKTEIPLGGSRETLDLRIVKRACEGLGLDWSQLPGPKSRVCQKADATVSRCLAKHC